MQYIYNDGGRKAAGYKGEADDCLVRAVTIAAELPYAEVYKALNESAQAEKYRRGKVGLHYALGLGSSARTGVLKDTANQFLRSLGWIWHPTMLIGQGCKVHLRYGELPPGRLIVKVSKHFVAVLDGVIHDTHDCSRDGTRCVYGYWTPPTSGQNTPISR